MARAWFTTEPSKYYLRLNRKGHRYEILFTALVLGYVHYKWINPVVERAARRTLDQESDWKRTTVGGSPFVIHPQEKIQLKFLA